MTHKLFNKIFYSLLSIVMLSILVIYFIKYSNPIYAETQWSPEIYYIVKQPEIKEELYYSKERIILVSVVFVVVAVAIIGMLSK